MKKVEKHGDYEVVFLSGKDVDEEIERLEKELENMNEMFNL